MRKQKKNQLEKKICNDCKKVKIVNAKGIYLLCHIYNAMVDDTISGGIK